MYLLVEGRYYRFSNYSFICCNINLRKKEWVKHIYKEERKTILFSSLFLLTFYWDCGTRFRTGTHRLGKENYKGVPFYQRLKENRNYKSSKALVQEEIKGTTKWSNVWGKWFHSRPILYILLLLVAKAFWNFE